MISFHQNLSNKNLNSINIPLIFHVFPSQSRLFDKAMWLGSKGQHGWTKMDTVRFRGKHWGDLGYRSKFYGTHQPCPHSGWTWEGHVGSRNSNDTGATRIKDYSFWGNSFPVPKFAGMLNLVWFCFFRFHVPFPGPTPMWTRLVGTIEFWFVS